MGLRFRPGSVGQYFDQDAKVECVEVHSSTCSHCQRLTEFPSMRKMMDHVDICRSCMKLVCLHCAGKPCRTWLQQCEIDEALWRRQFRDGA